MLKLTYLPAILVGCTLGVYTGAYFAKHNPPVIQSYSRDLDGDGRLDLVFKIRRGDHVTNLIYLQQADGSHRRLEQVQERFRSSIEEKVKNIM